LEKKGDIRCRADLAISSREIKFDKLERKLNFTVHNIGAKESGKFTVSLYAGDRKIQDLSVENIDAPTDLLPKRKELSFENPPENGKLRIVIDPNNEIQEITKTNNEAAFSFE
jgi:subtilase family serine protease